MGNVINQKIARAFLKKKTTGLMDEEVDLGGLRLLVWDCHNPVFWEGAGEGRFEGKREGMMGVNYRDGMFWRLVSFCLGLWEIKSLLFYLSPPCFVS